MKLSLHRLLPPTQLNTRSLFSAAALSLALALATASPLAAQTHQAAGATRPQVQYITVQDPAFGIPQGTMPFFANWRGSAGVDRRDNMSDPVVAYDFTSPDGSESIRQLGKSVATTVLPIMARNYPGMQLLRFSSTADLLNRVIVRQLELGGQPETPVEAPRQVLAMLGQGISPDMFVDAANVKVDNMPGGREAIVQAITAGHNRGQRGENTATTILIFSAPAGRVQALANAYATLPHFIQNPAWQQRQSAKDQRGQQQTAAQMADFNRRQAAFNATQLKINEMHRNTTAAASEQTRSDLAKGRQDTQDGAAVHIGILSGQTPYFKWCSPDGGSSQVTDSTFPPASGWVRCN